MLFDFTPALQAARLFAPLALASALLAGAPTHAATPDISST